MSGTINMTVTEVATVLVALNNQRRQLVADLARLVEGPDPSTYRYFRDTLRAEIANIQALQTRLESHVQSP